MQQGFGGGTGRRWETGIRRIMTAVYHASGGCSKVIGMPLLSTITPREAFDRGFGLYELVLDNWANVGALQEFEDAANITIFPGGVGSPTPFPSAAAVAIAPGSDFDKVRVQYDAPSTYEFTQRTSPADALVNTVGLAGPIISVGCPAFDVRGPFRISSQIEGTDIQTAVAGQRRGDSIRYPDSYQRNGVGELFGTAMGNDGAVERFIRPVLRLYIYYRQPAPESIPLRRYPRVIANVLTLGDGVFAPGIAVPVYGRKTVRVTIQSAVGAGTQSYEIIGYRSNTANLNGSVIDLATVAGVAATVPVDFIFTNLQSEFLIIRGLTTAGAGITTNVYVYMTDGDA